MDLLVPPARFDLIDPPPGLNRKNKLAWFSSLVARFAKHQEATDTQLAGYQTALQLVTDAIAHGKTLPRSRALPASFRCLRSCQRHLRLFLRLFLHPLLHSRLHLSLQLPRRCRPLFAPRLPSLPMLRCLRILLCCVRLTLPCPHPRGLPLSCLMLPHSRVSCDCLDRPCLKSSAAPPTSAPRSSSWKKLCFGFTFLVFRCTCMRPDAL